MIYPLVVDLAAPDPPVRVPVEVACRVLELSTQAFYQWKRDPVSHRDWDDAHLTRGPIDITDTRPVRASSVSARSRTAPRTGSSATPWPIG
jgi:putative transposase